MCKIRQKLPAFGRQCVQLKPCLQKCDPSNKHSSQLIFTPFSKTQINSTISTHFETAFLLASEGLDQTAHKRRLHAFLHAVVDLVRVTPPIPATIGVVRHHFRDLHRGVENNNVVALRPLVESCVLGISVVKLGDTHVTAVERDVQGTLSPIFACLGYINKANFSDGRILLPNIRLLVETVESRGIGHGARLQRAVHRLQRRTRSVVLTLAQIRAAQHGAVLAVVERRQTVLGVDVVRGYDAAGVHEVRIISLQGMHHEGIHHRVRQTSIDENFVIFQVGGIIDEVELSIAVSQPHQSVHIGAAKRARHALGLSI
mmetsp:Transcript_13759/g.24153  ORF Transcript_13759/g.24153 Transcript_13759/m.24153 type:complete len:315 (-) Transcript_13759:64-1008(-)